MATATKEKTADAELGVVQTRDLDNQSSQIENIERQIKALQADTTQRINNLEVNLRGMKKQRDESVAKLQDDYDAALYKGDAEQAGKILDKIKKCHEDLVNVARQIKESDGDIDDLRYRADKLHKQVLLLVTMARENRKLAEQLDVKVSSLLGILSSSINKDFLKYEEIHKQGLKVAEAILAE